QGAYMMGCTLGDDLCQDDERPAHLVKISKIFEIGKYEVTQAQWAAVMGEHPADQDQEDVNSPVINVSWNMIRDFMSKLNAKKDGYRYRLPTEAEWEYTARAGIIVPFTGALDTIAWYNANLGSHLHPVGGKQPNA